MIPESFGERLSRLRHRQGLRQAELGRIIGTSANTISSWESDHSNPKPHWRSAMALALGVTEVYLRTGQEMPARMMMVVHGQS